MDRTAQAGQAGSHLTSRPGVLLVRWRLKNRYEDSGAPRGLWWCALYARLGNQEVRVQEHELTVLPTVFVQNPEIPVSPLSELMLHRAEPLSEDRQPWRGQQRLWFRVPVHFLAQGKRERQVPNLQTLTPVSKMCPACHQKNSRRKVSGSLSSARLRSTEPSKTLSRCHQCRSDGGGRLTPATVSALCRSYLYCNCPQHRRSRRLHRRHGKG